MYRRKGKCSLACVGGDVCVSLESPNGGMVECENPRSANTFISTPSHTHVCMMINNIEPRSCRCKHRVISRVSYSCLLPHSHTECLLSAHLLGGVSEISQRSHARLQRRHSQTQCVQLRCPWLKLELVHQTPTAKGYTERQTHHQSLDKRVPAAQRETSTN